MKHRVLTGTALAGAMLLAACSGEPGVSNIRQAMKSSPQEQLSFEMVRGLNPSVPKSFVDFVDAIAIEKGECREAKDAPGYICDFRAGFAFGGGQPQFGPWAKARFFKANGSWNEEPIR